MKTLKDNIEEIVDNEKIPEAVTLVRRYIRFRKRLPLIVLPLAFALTPLLTLGILKYSPHIPIDKDEVVLLNNRKKEIYKYRGGYLRMVDSGEDPDYAPYIHDTNADGVADYHIRDGLVFKVIFDEFTKPVCPSSLQEQYQEAYQLSKFFKEEN